MEKNIPVFNFVIDHPRIFNDTLEDPEADIYLLTLDRNHTEFCKKYYPKLKDVFFVPHAGVEWTNSTTPYDHRSIDVLYMGDCQLEIKDLPRIRLFSDGGNDLYQKVSVKLYTNPLLSTENAISEYLNDAGVVIERESDEYILMRNVGNAIDKNLRRISKLSGMQALDQMGIHVDIYGDNWIDPEFPLSENISIHKRVEVGEILETLGNTKISLCFIPWFRGGCSEKNLDSMLNGAVCVSDRSEYLLEHYNDGEDIVYFDISNPGQMAADVKWLLEHPKQAAIIASNGQKKARQYDSWEIRNRQICELITECLGL